MQKTRQQILDVINHKKQATVNEIVEELQHLRGDQITAVTVRHHLNLLQKENYITCPEIRHKNRPGRPQHVYILTEKAHNHLPSNYKMLTTHIIEEVRKSLPPQQVNVIFEGIADEMAQTAQIPNLPIEERFGLVIEYLNDIGYDATWEKQDDGYMLYTSNCPYHDIAQHDETLCHMDHRLIASLVGITPRSTSRISQGESVCSYFFPVETGIK